MTKFESRDDSDFRYIIHELSKWSNDLRDEQSLHGRTVHAEMAGSEIAISTLGLAGLFNNAIDWFEHIYITK
jgi:hypothetical protein